jgi:hypothetical protein
MCQDFGERAIFMEQCYNPGRIPATPWQHTLAQWQRLGKSANIDYKQGKDNACVVSTNFVAQSKILLVVLRCCHLVFGSSFPKALPLG